MNPFWVVVVCICLGLGRASSGSAQYLFLDLDGDASSSASDKLNREKPTSVDVWIQTDTNRDGSRAESGVVGNRPLTISSYEFILRAVDGTVEWGKFSNLQPTMYVRFGPRMNDTDYYDGFGGLEALPPGKYKLGTLNLKVKSGSPRLVFVSKSPVWNGAGTSFGSQREGKDGDNTLKFTEDASKLRSPSHDIPGDWIDADGLEGAGSGTDIATSLQASLPVSFSVSVTPNPANPKTTIKVQTTRQGFLRVRLFNLSGRLVRTLWNEESASPGIHLVLASSSTDSRALPSGVYLYRVESSEKSVSGKLVIMK